VRVDFEMGLWLCFGEDGVEEVLAEPEVLGQEELAGGVDAVGAGEVWPHLGKHGVD